MGVVGLFRMVEGEVLWQGYGMSAFKVVDNAPLLSVTY